jgi:hypothetical protein
MAAAVVSIGVGNADDGVPLQFSTADSNTNDSITHIETWTTLRTAAGRRGGVYHTKPRKFGAGCGSDRVRRVSPSEVQRILHFTIVKDYSKCVWCESTLLRCGSPCS